MTPFDVLPERAGRSITLRVRGDLDMASCRKLESILAGVEASTPELVVLDLREVTFMDSTGLRTLLAARDRAGLGGWSIGLVRAPENVHRVLELTRTDSLFPIVEPPVPAGP